ncbi:MAG TPA: hypothetical protein VG204_19110, partial [Terriglobia bacterium]|nr:hypothetical protein [Terriglobia bacterium]
IQQSHRLPATALQSLEVSAYSFWVAHADIDASSAPLVALYYTNLNSLAILGAVAYQNMDKGYACERQLLSLLKEHYPEFSGGR